MSNDVFIGIDTGATGAIAVINTVSGSVCFKDLNKPTLEIFNWLVDIKIKHNCKIVLVEKVHAISGSAAKGTFTFGRNFQKILTIVELTGLGIDFCTPKEWQKANSIVLKNITLTKIQRKSAIKRLVANKCIEKYPSAEKDLLGPRNGLRDGRSDSLMIAHYNLIKLKEKQMKKLTLKNVVNAVAVLSAYIEQETSNKNSVKTSTDTDDTPFDINPLHTKAKELGIKFRADISDATLQKRIDDAENSNKNSDDNVDEISAKEIKKDKKKNKKSKKSKKKNKKKNKKKIFK